MSIYDKSSLVLIPSGTKTSKVYSQVPTNGDGDFDFTRSTAATRIAANGNIEKETSNLFTYSNDLSNAIWQLGLITATSGQAGYDGSSDAWLITKDAAAYRAIEHDINNSGVYTYSVYAKANTLNLISLRDQTLGQGAGFNLTNGTTYGNSGVSSSIDSVGGGWYRCSVTFNGSSTRLAIYIDFDNATAGSVFVQDFQLEQGLVARDYQETTATAVYGGITDNTPRLDYTDSSCPALLLEPQRTNSYNHSEYIADSYWLKYQCAITANQAVSPDGYNNASLFTANVSGDNVVYKLGISYGALSFFAKADNLSAGAKFYIAVDSVGNAKWNQDGTISSQTGGLVTATDGVDYGNGWYRFTYVVGVGSVHNFGLSNSTSGDTAYIWGVQSEPSVSYATSYIPTYGSSVSRVVDKVDGQEDASLYNDSEGVLFVEFSALSDTRDNEFRFLISNGTNSERLQIGLQTSGNLYASVITGNSASASFSYSLPNPTQTHKIALKYKVDDCVLFVDGVERGTDTSATMPSGLDVFDFYRTSVNNNYVEANVKQVLYFKTALSNEELATLTTI